MRGELPDFIRCGRAICGDLTQAERREWWLANGLGGYAAGTVAGTLTRCYHGLLIAPVHPPLDRRLVFAKADATLVDGDRDIALFSNRWAGSAVNPPGHVHLESFRLEGRMPVWRFAVGDIVLEQRIWLEPGANTSYVAWRLAAENIGRDLQLRVRLLVNGRDHHARTRMSDFQPALDASDPAMRQVHTPDFTLRLWARGGVIVGDAHWFEHFDLPVEHERGLAYRDHHFCIGEAVLTLQPGVWTGVIASLQEGADLDLGAAQQRFLNREIALLTQAETQAPELRGAPDWVRQLALAADGFLFARPLPDLPDGESVIAGYPWFGDWGRDTMIALPGLTLATGRSDTARRILLTFARFIDRGMLPNLFPSAAEPLAYNTVDAALWYVEAWRAYLETSADSKTLVAAFPVLQEIIAWHVAGTRYGIGMDSRDGLLRAGEPGTQLTWMDAKIGDWVVTPRVGKPVEINALWYNALRVVADFARQLGQSPAFYDDLAMQAGDGFQRFVRPDGEGLYDVLDGPDGDDARIRPNQIFAVSLRHSPLDPVAQQAAVRVCGRELLTSYGLRSLAPRHAEFRPYYLGDVRERDSSYHQGPVWAWLLGHYALADHRVHGDAAAAQAWLEPIRDHLLDAGLGAISEIFDGAPPHQPRGAPAQAWSVACVLEAWQRLERSKRISHHADAITGH
ncbi:MAG: glycogen debranching enzyme family protein [Candidatus Competibacter sp.]|nr:glycogen debranching enzyme family protein [Candidatus Competibacter sp.]MDG4606751.1 amylo-alpha-1,6-glucosidase [Candidatus Contendobacter sp.]HRD48885.1 amylo-alpha-1,6-glucosidase [Candidatus Contendobacter sp.]